MDYLGNLRAPPHRSSTAVVYLYVCRASDICIFVSVHTLHLCAELGSKQEPSQPQHSPAIKRLIFLRHETMCRRLMGSYTSITYHSTMRRLHLYSSFFSTLISLAIYWSCQPNIVTYFANVIFFDITLSSAVGKTFVYVVKFDAQE